MGFTEQATLAANTIFRNKVRIAAVKAAIAVAGEVPSGVGARDEKRHSLALKVLADGGVSALDSFVWAVVSGGIVLENSPDNDIEFTVNSIWNDLAGVRGVEAQ